MNAARHPRFSPMEGGLALVFVLIIAGLAYGVAGGPGIFGHTSDQVKFLVTTVTSTCTSSASTSCTATCAGPNKVAFSGTCISDTPIAWTEFGSATVSSVNDSWRCQNTSHSPGKQLLAIAVCVQGGA